MGVVTKALMICCQATFEPDYVRYAHQERVHVNSSSSWTFRSTAGDQISAEVKYLGSNTYELTLNDLTTNESFSKSVQSNKPTRSSAEWIVEGTKQLANFNTVTFSDASATTANGYTGAISDPAWQYDPITMVSKKGNVSAAPSALLDDGSSFSVSYAASNNNTVGTGAVSDGTHAANMALLVQYIASSFVPSAAGFGTLVHSSAHEHPPQMLTQPHHA